MRKRRRRKKNEMRNAIKEDFHEQPTYFQDIYQDTYPVFMHSFVFDFFIVILLLTSKLL